MKQKGLPEYEIVADGGTVTVTVADPVLSPAIDAQVPLVNVAMVYVVVEEGLTLTVIVGAVPLNGIAPGFNVPLMVPEPVAAMLNVAVPPGHIVVVPLNAPVGRSLTVMTALPVRSPAVEMQFASAIVLME